MVIKRIHYIHLVIGTFYFSIKLRQRLLLLGNIFFLSKRFGALPPSNSALRLLTILNFLISSYLVATLVGNISSFMIGRDR